MGEMMKCRYCREEHDESAFWDRKGSCPSCGMRDMSIAMECRMEKENGEDSTARLEMARKDPSALEKAVKRLKEALFKHFEGDIYKTLDPVGVQTFSNMPSYATVLSRERFVAGIDAMKKRMKDAQEEERVWANCAGIGTGSYLECTKPADRRNPMDITVLQMGMCDDFVNLRTTQYKFYRIIKPKGSEERINQVSFDGIFWIDMPLEI
ncbi:MAG: hypothetical protein HXS40_05955 [Theionarchaea archaeon]|nr:hypothetical protein [Theionarchaea archaeon]